MERLVSKQHYRPLVKIKRSGSEEYEILDRTVAQERANIYLSRALYLMEQDNAERYSNTINYELLIATDLGCADAAFLLACRTADIESRSPFPAEDAIAFLKLAADRGHPEAAYQLACCYAALGIFKQTEKVCANYLNSLEPRERQRFAELYFQQAVKMEHREAIEELIIAYAYGRGFINRDADKFIDLCESRVAANDQAVMLGYAAWLCGMTVEGEDPLPEAIEVPCEYGRAMELFLHSSRGSNLELAQHALHLFCLAGLRGVWDYLPDEQLEEKVQQEIAMGNAVLTLYLAWYSIPLHRRCDLPTLFDTYQLTQLATFATSDEEQAMAYLDKVLVSQNTRLAVIAKDILLRVFSYGNGEIEAGVMAN
jgi:hypothetical protein